MEDDIGELRAGSRMVDGGSIFLSGFDTVGRYLETGTYVMKLILCALGSLYKEGTVRLVLFDARARHAADVAAICA